MEERWLKSVMPATSCSQKSSRGSAKRTARDPDIGLSPIGRFVDFAKPDSDLTSKFKLSSALTSVSLHLRHFTHHKTLALKES